jgi:TolA-binding protein
MRAASKASGSRAAARLTASLASSKQAQDSLRTQLRSQSADIDKLEAENTEQRAVIKDLRLEVARLQAVQGVDAQDLVHLAGKLLALSKTTGVELDNTTKAIFRHRGWTAPAATRTGK